MRSNGVDGDRIYYTGKDYASFSWEPYVYGISTAIPLSDPDLEFNDRNQHRRNGFA